MQEKSYSTSFSVCPQKPCGPKFIPSNGKYKCPLTCEMYLNNTSTDDCTYDCGFDFCVCKKGYVLDDFGDCIAPEECSGHKICDEDNGEVWTNCGTDCEETCETYGKNKIRYIL